jgi:hypothetical protein
MCTSYENTGANKFNLDTTDFTRVCVGSKDCKDDVEREKVLALS